MEIRIDQTWIYALLLIAGIGLAGTLAFGAWVVWRVRRINVPAGADFLTTLRATPLSVVLLLDALDMALDVFSAPISWIILGRLGLGALRGVTVVKDLVPFTQFIPAMTVAWILARVFRPQLERFQELDRPRNY